MPQIFMLDIHVSRMTKWNQLCENDSNKSNGVMDKNKTKFGSFEWVPGMYIKNTMNH